MIVAVCAKKDKERGPVDGFFGRCAFFAFAEKKEGRTRISFEKNPFVEGGGVGIKAAKLVAEKKAECVVCENFGPRAMEILSQLGIRALKCSGTVEEAAEKAFKGKLKEESA